MQSVLFGGTLVGSANPFNLDLLILRNHVPESLNDVVNLLWFFNLQKFHDFDASNTQEMLMTYHLHNEFRD